jgi:hypothetical protein
MFPIVFRSGKSTSSATFPLAVTNLMSFRENGWMKNMGAHFGRSRKDRQQASLS